MLITSILGFILSIMALGSVAPSIGQAIYAKKVEIGISREEALMQQVIRYRAITGSYPATVADMVTAGYWSTNDNDNGLGGTYTFSVDNSKGLIEISTLISDTAQRAQYINNYRHVFKPVDMTGGVVKTTFIMPSAGSMGAPLPIAGAIPVSATAPSAASNTWWYDTSGATASLKVSDGVTWKAAASTGASGGPSADNIVASAITLPATGTDGDIRYMYNSGTSSLSSYVWYNGSWNAFGGTPAVTIESGFNYQADRVLSLATCAWNDGQLAYDALTDSYSCSDATINSGLSPITFCAIIGRKTADITGDVYQCQ